MQSDRRALGQAVMEGPGLGAREGPQPLGISDFQETSCFNRKASLSHRAGCPAATPLGRRGECQGSKREIVGDKKEKRTALVSLGRKKERQRSNVAQKCSHCLKRNAASKSSLGRNQSKGGCLLKGLVSLSWRKTGGGIL